jgi:tRNA 2-selenouridine synthase
MAAVGWKVTLLEGGYKAFRTTVRKRTETLCQPLDIRVLTGLTGAGKSRLLRIMATTGHQVLDLERLAAHRGSLLGDEPTQPQPAQKAFDTAIWQALESYSPQHPVWLESESRRVGKLFCPDPLWAKMIAAPVTEMITERPLRAVLLLEDYLHFQENPQLLIQKLRILTAQHGHERITEWEALIAAQKWREFTESLLEHHYDPAYRKAGKYNAPQHAIHLANNTPEAFMALATSLASAELNPPSQRKSP